MADLTRRGMLASAAAAVWCWPRSGSDPLPSAGSRFRLAEPSAEAGRPFFASSFIDHDPALPYVHCPSICELPNGRMACAWYAGSRETGRDVAIWFSETAPFTDADADIPWTLPRSIVDRASATKSLARYVDKVGNSVLFTDDSGRLWLVYVTIAVGGWSGSSLNACSSVDGGATWTGSHRLTLSPFFNISELVRAAPVALESGEIGLPIYHECLGKFPEMLWLEPAGDRLVATKSRLTGGRSFLQPAVVPLGDREAVAFLRDHSATHRLVEQRTSDGGLTWSPPVATPLPNPDASVAALRLSDGSLLVASNNSPVNRESIGLTVSTGAAGWRPVATLDNEAGQKFAYPFLHRDRRGLVHLVYTWKMRRIRHVVMNEAWIRAQAPEPVA